MNISLFPVLPRMLSRQNRKKGDSGAVPKAVLSESLSLDTTQVFQPCLFWFQCCPCCRDFNRISLSCVHSAYSRRWNVAPAGQHFRRDTSRVAGRSSWHKRLACASPRRGGCGNSHARRRSESIPRPISRWFRSVAHARATEDHLNGGSINASFGRRAPRLGRLRSAVSVVRRGRTCCPDQRTT